MIHYRPGSHLDDIITILSVVGEYPMCAVHLLGNERVYKALIHKLTESQTIRNALTNEKITCRSLIVKGKGRDKTIRFYKAGLPIFKWINADAYYSEAFYNHALPNNDYHRERNCRIAETVAMCMRAGIEFRPYHLPQLQNKQITRIIPDVPVLYLSRDIKRVGQTEMNKTMFTRMTGALFISNHCYAVYNTRNAIMKWAGEGELKARINLTDLARLNAGVMEIKSAILFADNIQVILKTILELEKNHRLELRFDKIYHHIHAVPMNEFGIRILKLLVIPDWNEKLLGLLFEPETRSFNHGIFEYDAYINNLYIYSFLDCDIARLIRLKEMLMFNPISIEILCFPEQVGFIRAYLGDQVFIKTISIDQVESAMQEGSD